jgi:hypothetical protein
VIMTWLLAHWKSLLLIIGGVAVWIVIMTVLKGKDVPPPQPALPVVQAVKIDTTATQSTSVVKSGCAVKRKVKVRVVVPPETVVGDSDMVIEVVIEDSSKNEATVEETKIEDKGLQESITITNQEVVPVVKHERVIGIFAGAGYLPSGVIVPEVGISAHVYKLAYLQAGAGLDGIVFGFGGGALKIGEVFGLRILAGVGYTTDKQVMVSISLGG